MCTKCVRVHVHVHVHVHVRVRVCVRTRARARVCVCACVRACVAIMILIGPSIHFLDSIGLFDTSQSYEHLVSVYVELTFFGSFYRLAHTHIDSIY